ncbi:Ff.00g080400.m01.CDS01 [Fusarium sp. VM40]|nr:Ff.00g080400.m01.CDS01 [Fusarium sp. VM40]
MSATTTQTVNQNGNFHSAILRDYELHHSQSSEKSPETPSSTSSVNHPEFDLPHRRVPSYRPLNRDPEHVNGVRMYTSTPELFFITAMFRGLYANASAAQYWRASVGKFTDKVWKYHIGGEF